MQNINQLLEDAHQAQLQGHPSQALTLYKQALLQYPNELDLQIVCGNICVELGFFEEASGYFRRILAFNKSPEARNALCYALNALGNEAQAMGNYALAEACFDEALQHQPKNAVYWYNLGNAQRELGDAKKALSSYQKSIQINPDDPDAHNNLGNVQRELGKLDLAIAAYKRALQLNPNLYHALVHLVHQKQHICDWGGLNAEIETIRDWVKNKPEAQVSPFAFLAMPGTTAKEQQLCASQYAAQHYATLLSMQNSVTFNHKKEAKKKLKIGYLSADFRLHPLAFLISELIEQHDRTEFEILAYSYGTNDKTPARKHLEKVFDRFYDIRNLNEIDAAKKIYADNVDILIDLTGFTQSSRTGIVALKPAPISINWLGYPGTMGAIDKKPLFDYLLSDKIIVPNTHEINENHFSEKLLYLPCYQPNNTRKSGLATQKSDHRLPDNVFVFCSFNQTFKFTEEMFAIWMRLLKQVPGSVLWMLDCNIWAKENLQKNAELADIDKNRLIFAPRTNAEAHLERHRHADIFLDTLPYNAHTTASDALWMKLPVLTCIGQTFPGRVAASLLTNLGLSELICDSLQQYENKALYLAENPHELARIKHEISIQKTQSDLFKPAQFAKMLETQFKQIWQTYLTSQ
jgi:protein O-GlcNAc transferase